MKMLIDLLHVGPLGVALILFAVSGLYFRAGRDEPVLRRVLASSHGVILLFQMAPVTARDVLPSIQGAWLGSMLWWPLLLGLVAVAYSLLYSGRRWAFHSVHVVTLIYAGLANVYGYQALTH